MRTTFDIDDDILTIVKSMAKNKKIALGKVISRLLRERLTPDLSSVDKRNHFPVFKSKKLGQVVTNDEINKIKEELGI